MESNQSVITDLLKNRWHVYSSKYKVFAECVFDAHNVENSNALLSYSPSSLREQLFFNFSDRYIYTAPLFLKLRIDLTDEKAMFYIARKLTDLPKNLATSEDKFISIPANDPYFSFTALVNGQFQISDSKQKQLLYKYFKHPYTTYTKKSGTDYWVALTLLRSKTQIQGCGFSFNKDEWALSCKLRNTFSFVFCKLNPEEVMSVYRRSHRGIALDILATQIGLYTAISNNMPVMQETFYR
jgi:hypothetical protein